MSAYKHILLATDLSEHSGQIAKKALSIAQECNAQISIIHVIEHSPLAYGGEFSIPIDINLEQTIESNAKEMLNDFAQKYHIPEDHIHISMESVKLAVTSYAEKIHADLIVVGTHGHHGLDFLLGSRANAILHHAKCDVLAVRTHDKS